MAKMIKIPEDDDILGLENIKRYVQLDNLSQRGKIVALYNVSKYVMEFVPEKGAIAPCSCCGAQGSFSCDEVLASVLEKDTQESWDEEGTHLVWTGSSLPGSER